MAKPADRTDELSRLLDELSYQLTAARTAGVNRPEVMRGVLRRMSSLLTDIDSLAVTEIAERSKQED